MLSKIKNIFGNAALAVEVKTLKCQVNKLKASMQQDPKFDWQLRTLRDPKKRGQDNFDTKQKKLLKNIETARERDPIIFRMVDYYDKLAIGTGITMQCENPEVLRVAKRIWQENNFDDLQHQMAVELATTANLFAHMPKVSGKNKNDGNNYVIPPVDLLPSCQIANIATKDGKPDYYRRVWEDLEYPAATKGVQTGISNLTATPVQKYQDISPSEMIHVAINRGAKDLRGVSSLAPSLYWCKSYGRIMDTVWAVAVARSMLAIHMKFAGATDQITDEAKTKLEEQLVERYAPDGSTYATLAPAQTLLSGNDIEVAAIASDLKAGTIEHEIRRVSLMALMGPGMPECIVDGDYSNLASSITQSSPFYRLMQSFQEIMLAVFRRIYRLAFDRLLEAGSFSQIDLEENKVEHISELLEFAAPELLIDDPSEMIAALVPAVQADLISRQEAADMRGANWEDVSDQIKREREQGFKSTPEIQLPGSGPAMQMPPGLFNAKTAAIIARHIMAGTDPTTDAEGDARHEETQAIMERIRRAFGNQINDYKSALLRCNNATEAEAVKNQFMLEIWRQMKAMIDNAREVGRQSVNAAG